MTFTRRAFVLSALASPLAGGVAAAGQEATPEMGAFSDPVEVLRPAWYPIDLTPYAPGWRSGNYVTTAVFAQSHDIVMDGFDVATGERRWSTDLRAAFPDDQFINVGFAASPRRGESVAISHTDGADLFAVDAVTGEALWHLQMNSPEGRDGNMSLSFALHGGRIIGLLAGSHLYARDERTAEVLWQTELPLDRLWDTINGPVVSDSAVYLLDDTMHIHAAALEDGEMQWSRAPGPQDQLVYMQTFGDIVIANLEWEGVKRLDPQTGEDMWSNDDYLPYRHVETVEDGRVVIGISPTLHMLTAIELESGRTLWKREPDESSVEIVAQASNSSMLAIADQNNRVSVLDAMSGDELLVIEDLRLALAYPQSSQALAMTDEWLFISTDDLRITVVDLTSGFIVFRSSLVGISDGVVPVDLRVVESTLLAHAQGLGLGGFQIL